MSTFAWLLAGSLLMSALALVGSVSLLLSAETLDRVLLPLVAFSAGSLLGGALFHLVPGAIAGMGAQPVTFLWVFLGIAAFLLLEQFFHWHHAHTSRSYTRAPHTYLVLIGDAAHNLLGGLAVGGAFAADLRLGFAAWLAAAAHELPQEIGDFGILVHGGWSRRQALAWNFVSALTFPVGALLAWAIARELDVSFLLAFAAGNFLYIATSDLIPEIRTGHGFRRDARNLAMFAVGAALLYVLAVVLG